jgi:phosphate-selective porin OprO/OprP
MLTHFAVPSLLLFILASPSTAQEGETQVATPEEPAFAKATADKQEEKKPPRVSWDNGLWFRPRHTSFEMKTGGQAQLDSAGFVSNDTQPVELAGGVEWRRARIYVQGSFQRWTLEDHRWSFKFQWDFTGGGDPNLIDAWIGLNFNLWGHHLGLRGGRFHRSTFGLENDAGSNDTLFMEQGLTSAFVPPQETGVQLHSNSNRRRWDLSFSSSAKDLECTSCGVTGIAGRYASSFKFGREDKRLHYGINLSRRWTDDAVNYAERPESHIAPVFVDTGAFVAERVDAALAEGAFLDGAFSLQSEYAIVRVKRSELESPLFHAYYVSASYALTGEARPYRANLGWIRRIRPKRELRDGSGGLGAFEIAARFSYIDLNDKDITGGELADVSFAFNWYPTYPTRVSFNVIRADRESWDPVWIFQGRIQLAF